MDLHPGKRFKIKAATALVVAAAMMVPTASTATAEPTPPNPDTPTYHWSPTAKYKPRPGVTCKSRVGWARIDFDTIRLKYRTTCDEPVDYFRIETYVSRNNTEILNAAQKDCGDGYTCLMTRNVPDLTNKQSWKTATRFYFRSDSAPWLIYRFKA